MTKTTAAGERITLERRAIVAFRAQRGVVIECLDGELWLTADGLAGDHLLAAGERLELGGHRQIVVSALQPSLLSVSSARAEGSVLRLAGACAAMLFDRIRRWRHPPLAGYPATRLR